MYGSVKRACFCNSTPILRDDGNCSTLPVPPGNSAASSSPRGLRGATSVIQDAR